MAVERARQDSAGEAGGLTPQTPLGASRNRCAKGAAVDCKRLRACVQDQCGYNLWPGGLRCWKRQALAAGLGQSGRWRQEQQHDCHGHDDMGSNSS